MEIKGSSGTSGNGSTWGRDSIAWNHQAPRLKLERGLPLCECIIHIYVYTDIYTHIPHSLGHGEKVPNRTLLISKCKV